MGLPDEYYASVARDYQARRDTMLAVLKHAGFCTFLPHGAYYVMADISHFGFDNDVQCVRHLIERHRVAAVPGSSFFSNPDHGKTLIRFCFCKKYETLKAAGDRLSDFKEALSGRS